MALMNQKKKNVTGILLVCVAVVLVIVAAVYFIMREPHKEASSQEEMMETETAAEEETTMDSFVADKEEMSDGYKEYYIDYVFLPEGQNISGYVDIRIRFPNGQDYMVASGKTITGLAEEGFYILLNDRDVHMLSSAKTDMDVYQGTLLYLSAYETKQQETEAEDYPWNQYVISSYGIAAADAEDTYNRRIQLEENLIAFMNQALQK